MKIRETEAIILRSYKLAEADKIVVCFSREMGMVRGTARGARRLKSKFGASLEPYTLVTLSLYEKEGKELLTIRHAELVNSYFGLAREYQIMDSLAYLASLLIEFAQPHQPDERLYRLVKTCLATISQYSERTDGVIKYFEIWLLKLSGFMPEMRRCTRCRESLTTESQVALSEGAMFCQTCRGGQGITFSAEALSTMSEALHLAPSAWATIYQAASAAITGEISRATQLLLSRALERVYTPLSLGRADAKQNGSPASVPRAK